jgi:DNA-directed RNA polymerase specialized sigma subunit
MTDLPTPLTPIEEPAPLPLALHEQVKKLEPKLAYHLHRYGLGEDPLAKTQAQLLAAKAIETYKPESGASFGTWLDRSMQPLSRFKRQRATAVRVPEQIQIDAYRVQRARMEFEDANEREPELDELAEQAGLPLKRLNQIQQSFRKMSGEGAFENNLPSGLETDHAQEALEAIWEEADTRGRKILEHRTGFGGKPLIEPKDLAVQLQISPVELSRRSAKLGARLDELLEILER